MLKSCKYCGRIHDAAYICEQKAAAEELRRARTYNRDPKIDRFRKGRNWQRMAEHVRHRDSNLCLCCLHNEKGTLIRFNTENLSVHHISPISEDWNDKLNEDNLITVCSTHHEMCESGEIPRDVQHMLVEMSKNGTLISNKT